MLHTVSLLYLFSESIPSAGSLSCCYGEACLSQTWAHSWWESEGAHLFTPYFRMWLLVVSYLCCRSITICMTNQLSIDASIEGVYGWYNNLPFDFSFSFWCRCSKSVLSLLYVDYYMKSRFCNQYFQLKMKRLYLDNMKVTEMIQQFLTTQTLQHLQLLFSIYIMKDGKVV